MIPNRATRWDFTATPAGFDGMRIQCEAAESGLQIWEVVTPTKERFTFCTEQYANRLRSVGLEGLFYMDDKPWTGGRYGFYYVVASREGDRYFLAMAPDFSGIPLSVALKGSVYEINTELRKRERKHRRIHKVFGIR